MKKIRLHIEGMTCDGCERTVNISLTADGIIEKSANRKTGTADLIFDETRISPEQISNLVNDTEVYHVTSFENLE